MRSKTEAFYRAVRKGLRDTQIFRRPVNGHDTSGFSRSYSGLIFAESEQDVAHVLKCASRFQVAVKPVSTGLNAGYGDGFPEAKNQIVLNLSRMNRILELNREEGWLRLQPGASQGQVAEFLKREAPEFSFELTYWIQESSVLGNALERGRTLLTERERDLIGAKLILAGGKSLRTGFDPSLRSPRAQGLNLHALIFQSNLGVAVEGVLRLRRQDERVQFYLLGFKDFQSALKAFEAVKPLNGARPLRWFCPRTLKDSSSGNALAHGRGGALALEIDRRVKPHILRRVTGAQVMPISREDLMTHPPELGIHAHASPFSFFSFTVRRSAREFRHAQKLVRSLRREFKVLQTISFLEDTAAFLLRVHIDPAQHQFGARVFFRVKNAISAQGYELLRGHSGMPTNQLPDAKLKKMIKLCFDPERVIAPGRYGLS